MSTVRTQPCGQWIGGLANMWRTTGDIQATWRSVMSNIHAQDNMASITGVGAYNDPDMLQVGNVGLSLVEQRSHFSLWCITAAPLLAGTDIVHASKDTLEILTAAGPLSVNEVGRAVMWFVMQNGGLSLNSISRAGPPNSY